MSDPTRDGNDLFGYRCRKTGWLCAASNGQGKCCVTMCVKQWLYGGNPNAEFERACEAIKEARQPDTVKTYTGT